MREQDCKTFSPMVVVAGIRCNYSGTAAKGRIENSIHSIAEDGKIMRPRERGSSLVLRGNENLTIGLNAELNGAFRTCIEVGEGPAIIFETDMVSLVNSFPLQLCLRAHI